MYKKLLGECIKTSREKLNITQQKLSEDVGVTVNTISNIERGVAYPSMDVLFRLNELLDFPMEGFFNSIKNYNEYINLAELNENVAKLSIKNRTFADKIYNFIVESLLEME